MTKGDCDVKMRDCGVNIEYYGVNKVDCVVNKGVVMSIRELRCQ